MLAMDRPEFDTARDLDEAARLEVKLGAPYESLLFDVVADLEREARTRQDPDAPTTDERINLQTIGGMIMGYEAGGNDSIHFPATIWGEWILWQTAVLGAARLAETLLGEVDDRSWWTAEVVNAAEASRDAASRLSDFVAARDACSWRD